MSKRKQFAAAVLWSIAIWVPALGLGAFSASWWAAVPREQALAMTKERLPEDWKFVVFNHGVMSQWRYGLAKDHPAGFLASSVAAVVLAFVAGGFVDRSRRLWNERKCGEPTGIRRETNERGQS